MLLCLDRPCASSVTWHNVVFLAAYSSWTLSVHFFFGLPIDCLACVCGMWPSQSLVCPILRSVTEQWNYIIFVTFIITIIPHNLSYCELHRLTHSMEETVCVSLFLSSWKQIRFICHVMGALWLLCCILFCEFFRHCFFKPVHHFIVGRE